MRFNHVAQNIVHVMVVASMMMAAILIGLTQLGLNSVWKERDVRDQTNFLRTAPLHNLFLSCSGNTLR